MDNITYERNKKMAKKVLEELGSVYRTDDPLDYNASVEQACSYVGYSLKIVASNLPGYVDPNVTKKYIEDIYVEFDNKIVFDTKTNIYLPGIWEEILQELYNKLPVFQRKRLENEKKREYQNELFTNVIYIIWKKGKRKVNDNLCITRETEYDNYSGYNGETYYHYKVFKDGNLVFLATERGFKDFGYGKYVPGDWEQELRNFLFKLEREEEEKKQEEVRKNLTLLRSLK